MFQNNQNIISGLIKIIQIVTISFISALTITGQNRQVELIQSDDKSRYLVIKEADKVLDTISRANINMVVMDYSFFNDGSVGIIWKTPAGPVFYERWYRKADGVRFFSEQIGYEQHLLRPGQEYVKESFKIKGIDTIEKKMEFQNGKIKTEMIEIKKEYNFTPKERLIYKK
jgi:hypothetical protein